MSGKVTMQDIANATGYSRNTVSKALNGNPSVPGTTRMQIIEKATEMQYKHFAQAPAGPPRRQGTIALFTYHMPNNSHFGSPFISAFTERIGQAGYTLTMYLLQDSDVKYNRTPLNFVPEAVDGILCIELFDPAYSRFLCGLGLPIIYADTFAGADFESLPADLIMMENQQSVKRLVTAMRNRGAQSIGFVGDKAHCNSFHERWLGYCGALAEAGLSPNPAACILEDDRNPYNSAAWLREQLGKMQSLPDGFICANDFIAIHLAGSLKQMGVSIPEQIFLAGFDDSPESRVLEPRLTTVRIPGGEMGLIAARMLLERIAAPNMPFQRVYVATEPDYRESL